MLAFLTVAVVFVGVLCLGVLLLTVGVIRRLRQHSEWFANMANLSTLAGVAPQPRAGAVIGEFEAVDTGGRRLTRDLLETGTLAGFFTLGCAPCKALLPSFVDYAKSLAGESGSVVAVVAAPAESAERDEMVALLSTVARVVVEPPRGPASTAFGISGFPTLVLVGGDATVRAAGPSLDAVRRDVASPA